VEILVAGILVLALDQGTKLWVRTRSSHSVGQSPIVRIREVRAVRPTFGHRRGRVSLIVGWAIGFISVWMLLRTGAGLQTELARIGAGAALGGATGNLVDILRRCAVTDFIDFGWWPAFNLADVGIVVGLMLAFVPIS
jgi:signal peptidase II